MKRIKAQLDEREFQCHIVAEKVSQLILENFGPETGSRATLGAAAFELACREEFNRIDHDGNMRRLDGYARKVVSAWTELAKQEKRRLANGWTMPEEFPTLSEFLQEQAGYCDTYVDCFLEVDGAPEDEANGHLKMDLAASTHPVRIMVRAGTKKADAIAAARRALAALERDWDTLIAPAAEGMDVSKSEEPHDWPAFKGAVSEALRGGERKARAELGESLDELGEAGEKIAGFVLAALSHRPASLVLEQLVDPDKESAEIFGRLALRVDGADTVMLDMPVREPRKGRRPLARRAGGEGKKRVKRAA